MVLSSKRPFVPNREELAWAAGFFDGEGTFSINYDKRSKHRSSKVTIQQNDLEALNRFRNAVGLGAVGGPIRRANPRGNPTFWYCAYSFEKFQTIFALLYPFLGTLKRNQGLKVLEKMK